MKSILTDLDSLKACKRPCVLAIGMFDGLHRGHLRVIETASEIAGKKHALTCVLTFAPHPSKVVDMGRTPVKMLFPAEIRARMFEDAGAKKVFVKKFDKTFGAMTPESFGRFLKEKFPKLRAIVTGSNFVFGKGASGNPKTLAKMAEENGWEYRSVGGVAQGGRCISSTRLRDAVIKGDMALYKKLSGENYTATGTTKTGKRLGRKIGFPTINLPWDPECKPPFGVYAAILECAGATYEGVANYGTSPTVGKTEPLVETHLFAKNVPFGARRRTKVRFLKLLRPQKKFSNLQQLKQQIEKDANEAKSFFAKESGKLRQSRKGAQ